MEYLKYSVLGLSLLETAKRHSYIVHKFDNIRDYIITDSNKDILNYMHASNRITSFKDVKNIRLSNTIH